MYAFALFLLLLFDGGLPAQLSTVETTSKYLGQWRAAINAEMAKADRSGNDLKFNALKREFMKEAEEYKDQKVNWTMKVAGAKDGVLYLESEYRFKGHAIAIDASVARKDIEPWMYSLRKGSVVKVSATIEMVLVDTVFLNKVSISR